MSIPTVGPAAAARALPGGIPILRRQLIDDLVVYRCGLDVDAAVDSTGGFADDFLGRVNRTAGFVQQMNLGSLDEVHRGLRRVRAMHRRVQGTSPDGIDFDATDVDLQAWVSMTFTDSLLVANQRFGRRRLGRSEADRFVREQSLHGALLDERVDLDAMFDDPGRTNDGWR